MFTIIEAPTVNPIKNEKNPEIPKEKGHCLRHLLQFYDWQQFSFFSSFWFCGATLLLELNIEWSKFQSFALLWSLLDCKFLTKSESSGFYCILRWLLMLLSSLSLCLILFIELYLSGRT